MQKKNISFKDKEDFDIQCTKQTTIEVTTLPFLYKPPKDMTSLNIAQIKAITSRHLITKLEASVNTMDISTSTINIRDSDCEMKTCCLADETGTISLTLWDAQIDQVEKGKSYTFTNLSPCPQKRKFHRCTTCKILRKGSSYITKLGFLTIQDNAEELSLITTNSLLTKFLNKHNNVNSMDNQDIEEFFMTFGPINITYTENNQIVNLQTITENAELQTHNTSDDELSEVVEQLPEDMLASEQQIPQSQQKEATTDDHIKKKQKQV